MVTEKDIKELDVLMQQYARLKTLIKKRDAMTVEIEKLSTMIHSKIGVGVKDLQTS
jgi:anaerobic ribonucleoside-triphosphate reductase